MKIILEKLRFIGERREKVKGNAMEIKEFVSQTLKQIINGVVDAQEQTQGTNAVVVPSGDNQKKVDFDIAVTVVEGKGTSAKAGISICSIGAGVAGKTESSRSIVSRIKFEIPIDLPQGADAAEFDLLKES